jgi:hypothetical protein
MAKSRSRSVPGSALMVNYWIQMRNSRKNSPEPVGSGTVSAGRFEISRFVGSGPAILSGSYHSYLKIMDLFK